ncbi:MAG: hypothetical protein OXS33_00515 [bacterium]|nr:hypothetical protein [bacterium]
MRKLKGAIALMAVLTLLAAACGGETDDTDAAAEAAAEAAAAAEAQAAAEAEAQAAAAAAAEAQAAADAAAADAAAAQAELDAAQAELDATRAAAEAGDEEAQAALAAAEEAAAEAEAAAAAAAMEAEEAQQALEESRMVEAPGIRDVEVAMGIGTCCADFAYWQIPIELDWWAELGITIVPNTPTYWYLTNSTETNAKLQRQELHMANGWVPSLFAALETFAQEIPVIHFADIFIGYAVLVSPESDSKTALEFMAEGMSYPEAAKAAVQQLVGEDIYITPGSTVQAQYANAFFSYLDAWWEDVQEDIPIVDDEGNPLVLMNRDGTPRLDDDGNVQPIRITTNDWRNYANPQYVEDPVIVELSAVPGRIDYAMPFQAPTLVQMIRNGWDPLINFAQIFEHDPVSQQGAIAAATTGGTGLIANREWVEANKDVTYRVLSVAHRIFDFLDDPETQYIGWEIEANLINEKRQLTMEPEDIGVIWDQIDPSFSWADQEALWDLSLPSYHPETVFRNQVEERKAKGELSADYDTQAGLEKFLLAQELYYDMKGMQERADELFARAEGMDLSESQAALVAQARYWYDIFNFYDAERWLEAALIG